MERIHEKISTEMGVAVEQVKAAAHLLEEATVPFIARYRKEATGGLDDRQLRFLEERLSYLKQLEERREFILQTIREQEKLTPELEASIRVADTLVRLEDLYLPYRPKRRTKAQIAREAGLEPLAQALLKDPSVEPAVRAEAFVDAEKGVPDVASALDGARQILMEIFSEDAELVGGLRDFVWANGAWESTVIPGKEEEGVKFSDYFAFREPLRKLPSHRILALFRGRREKILRLSVVPDERQPEPGAEPSLLSRPESLIAERFGIEPQGRPADAWLRETVRWAWKVKILSHLETDIENQLRDQADEEAIRVFGENLRDLLLAAPAGSRGAMGLDPGLRTGVKVAVVAPTGKLVDTATIYPHEPRKEWARSIEILAQLARRHSVELISIGNGTASRETHQLARELINLHPELKLTAVVVSEAGASVYSASEFASQEFPELDVSLRGAVSIARRLQDPLAELVKIDPKSIGVGQYQHDVNQGQLARKLDAVVEDCVNGVGVELNTASVPLLTRVSGLGPVTARNIIQARDQSGGFRNRLQLMKVMGLGPKTFEQCAGFLRIREGDNPLDATAVHPEAYPVVERIVQKTGKPLRELVGDRQLLARLNPADFTFQQFGEPTVRDILRELEKPGRDPRPEFKTASFQEGVESLEDLKPGMVLEGVVTNVANFGAFVDVGVHQDGLVHVSELADKFIRDPREAVRTGDLVKVKVLEVDLKRKRISLSIRAAATVAQASSLRSGPEARPSGVHDTKVAQASSLRNDSAVATSSLRSDSAAATSSVRKPPADNSKRLPNQEKRPDPHRPPQSKKADAHPAQKKEGFNQPFSVLKDWKGKDR